MGVNRPRLSELLKYHGFVALVAVAPESLLYLFGYEAQQSIYSRTVKVGIVPADEEAPMTLVTPAGEAGWIVDQNVDIRASVRPFGTLGVIADPSDALDDAERRIAALVAERASDPWTAVLAALSAIGPGRVAVEVGALTDALGPLTARDDARSFEPGGEEILKLARMIKTPAEVALIRTAAAVNNEAIAGALGLASTLDEDQVARAYRASVARAGGVAQHWIGSSGRRTGMFRKPGRARPQVGERMRYDAGMSVGGYCSDLGGTVQVSAEPSSDERRVYAAVTAGIETALAGLRPGRHCSELYLEIVEAIRRAGVPEYAFPLVGHGIGVEQRDHPTIAAATPSAGRFTPADLAIEAGMVVNVETPWSVLGEGGYQHEVTVLVTETGLDIVSGPRAYGVV